MTLTRGFWFADLESGDGFGGRAAGLGQQLVAVVDAEGMVGGLDGQGSSSVDDSDVNCRAMVMAPRLLTRRSTWTGPAAGWGDGPAGRASRLRASSEGVSGLGRLRSSMPSWTSWSRPWSRRTVRRRPAK